MDVETTFKFIEQVHSNECLWSITSKAYRNKLLRDDLWNSIAVQFNITGPEAYACFRKLREKYRREAEKCKGSSGKAASQPSKWPFMKSLEFLDDAYKKRKVSNSETWAHDIIITLDEGEMEELESRDVSCTPQKVTETIIEKRRSNSRPRSKTPGAGNNMAEALRDTTDKILGAFHSESRHEDVVTFIRGTFNCISEEAAKNFEAELMNIAMKFRFQT